MRNELEAKVKWVTGDHHSDASFNKGQSWTAAITERYGVSCYCCLARASLLREDWATAEQIERVQLQLQDVVDFINRFHASVKTRLAVLYEKMTAVERQLRHVENAVRKARPSGSTHYTTTQGDPVTPRH